MFAMLFRLVYALHSFTLDFFLLVVSLDFFFDFLAMQLYVKKQKYVFLPGFLRWSLKNMVGKRYGLLWKKMVLIQQLKQPINKTAKNSNQNDVFFLYDVLLFSSSLCIVSFAHHLIECVCV